MELDYRGPCQDLSAFDAAMCTMLCQSQLCNALHLGMGLHALGIEDIVNLEDFSPGNSYPLQNVKVATTLLALDHLSNMASIPTIPQDMRPDTREHGMYDRVSSA